MAIPDSAPQTIASVPPLREGDRLTRAEFERRYEAMPHLKKAELIEGVVYMASAVRWNQHGHQHFNLISWLGFYSAATPGVQGGDNTTVRLDEQNEPQPDALLLIHPDSGGQMIISDDDYLEGAPELAAEVSSSTVQLDLQTKLQVYQRNRVREYLVWRVDDAVIDWFTRRNGVFERLQPGTDGVLRSETFPGLWLDPVALAVKDDMPRVLQVLQQGLATPEHAAFVERLRQTAARSGSNQAASASRRGESHGRTRN